MAFFFAAESSDCPPELWLDAGSEADEEADDPEAEDEWYGDYDESDDSGFEE